MFDEMAAKGRHIEGVNDASGATRAGEAVRKVPTLESGRVTVSAQPLLPRWL